MEWKVTQKPLTQLAVDGIVVLHTEGGEADGEDVKEVDEVLDFRISRLIADGETTGKYGEITLLHTWDKIPAKRVFVLGLGKAEELDVDRLRQGFAIVARKAEERGLKHLGIALPASFAAEKNAADLVQAAVEGVELGAYRYRGYKGDSREASLTSIFLSLSDLSRSGVEAGLERGKVFARATNLARTWVNEPANRLTPAALADQAAEVAKRNGLKVDILDEQRIEEMRMGGLLAVSQGSAQPPRMIVLSYFGAPESQEVLGLVGKGITFDSGGLQAKPAKSMNGMKDDMAGAAAVIAAMEGIGTLKPHSNVIAVVPACENSVDGKSYRPGDVIQSFSGKTIEIEHTDAEGRLILADALAYARRLGATRLVDVATLTGAIVVALGREVTGLMTNEASWGEEVKTAARLAGERVWELPMVPEYEEWLRSSVADLKNHGGISEAGAIQGAAFLKQFVEETPWVHLDIAGTAYFNKTKGIHSEGGTGVGVRTLIQLAIRFAGR